MFRGLFVFLTVVSVSLAAISIRELDPKPEEFKNVEGCYITERNDVVPVNERRPSTNPAKCEEYICNEDNVQVATCGAVSASGSCRVVPGDANAPYPGCCPTISCSTDSKPPCN